MSDTFEENGLCLLSRTTGVDLNVTTKTDFYTGPAGFKFVVFAVLVHTMSGAQAAPTDMNFGDGAAADNWEQALDMSTMNTTTEMWYLTKSGLKDNVIYDAGDVFGGKPDVAAGGALTVVVDVIGILIPA
jgi:hypothetical protein